MVVKAKQQKTRDQASVRNKLGSLLYDSGANSHYPTQNLQQKANLKIKGKSSKESSSQMDI